MTAVEVCLICDIAECRHIRERKAKMTQPTDGELDALVERARDAIDRVKPAGVLSSNAKLSVALFALYDLLPAITDLRAQLAEAHVTWPLWAAQIKEKLESYGVDPGDEWNVAEQFENWLDEAVEIETAAANARADRAEADITSLTASCAELATENEQLRAERDDYAYKLNAANDTYTEMHLEIERWRDRADRAEAALTAQIEADAWQPIDTAPTDYTHVIGIDAKGCVARTWFFAPSSLTRQWLRVGLPGKAVWHPTHWKPFRETTAQPHDRTALDRMLRAEREKALREAADAFMDGSAPRMTILALIEQENQK